MVFLFQSMEGVKTKKTESQQKLDDIAKQKNENTQTLGDLKKKMNDLEEKNKSLTADSSNVASQLKKYAGTEKEIKDRIDKNYNVLNPGNKKPQEGALVFYNLREPKGDKTVLTPRIAEYKGNGGEYAIMKHTGAMGVEDGFFAKQFQSGTHINYSAMQDVALIKKGMGVEMDITPGVGISGKVIGTITDVNINMITVHIDKNDQGIEVNRIKTFKQVDPATIKQPKQEVILRNPSDIL